MNDRFFFFLCQTASRSDDYVRYIICKSFSIKTKHRKLCTQNDDIPIKINRNGADRRGNIEKLYTSIYCLRTNEHRNCISATGQGKIRRTVYGSVRRTLCIFSVLRIREHFTDDLFAGSLGNKTELWSEPK